MEALEGQRPWRGELEQLSVVDGGLEVVCPYLRLTRNADTVSACPPATSALAGLDERIEVGPIDQDTPQSFSLTIAFCARRGGMSTTGINPCRI